MNTEQKYLLSVFESPMSVLPPMIQYMCLEFAGLVYAGKRSCVFIIFNKPYRRMIIKGLYKDKDDGSDINNRNRYGYRRRFILYDENRR